VPKCRDVRSASVVSSRQWRGSTRTVLKEQEEERKRDEGSDDVCRPHSTLFLRKKLARHKEDSSDKGPSTAALWLVSDGWRTAEDCFVGVTSFIIIKDNGCEKREIHLSNPDTLVQYVAVMVEATLVFKLLRTFPLNQTNCMNDDWLTDSGTRIWKFEHR
jgi:hypothetical protein